jgi:hypothetical protein
MEIPERNPLFTGSISNDEYVYYTGSTMADSGTNIWEDLASFGKGLTDTAGSLLKGATDVKVAWEKFDTATDPKPISTLELVALAGVAVAGLGIVIWALK